MYNQHMKILVATKNPAKFKEIEKYLGDKFEKVALPFDAPNIEETEKTFFDNALIKAKAYFDLYTIEEHEEINHRRFVYSELGKRILLLEK